MHNEVLSVEPFVCQYFDVFTEKECDSIIEGCGEFYPSRNYNSDSKIAEISKIRTSSTFFDSESKFEMYQKKIYSTLKERFDWLDFNMSHFEPMIILKYLVGQQYYEHKDFFNDSNTTLTQNDRFATAILYLNDEFEGGETFFKYLKIKVTPKKGSILFFDYKYNYGLNMLTRHQGLPVYKGTKYIATQWIRYKPYKYDINNPIGN